MPNDPLLAAIELLKTMDRDSTRILPDRPPSTFLLPKWRKLIFANVKPTDDFMKRLCSPCCATG